MNKQLLLSNVKQNNAGTPFDIVYDASRDVSLKSSTKKLDYRFHD